MSDFGLPLSIALGVGLAAATGFRVFLPTLIVSGAAYIGHLPLSDSFAWLGTADDEAHHDPPMHRVLTQIGFR
jgi:Domain of unknown function (DUF4126)